MAAWAAGPQHPVRQVRADARQAAGLDAALGRRCVIRSDS
jgi:hypothetical protein